MKAYSPVTWLRGNVINVSVTLLLLCFVLGKFGFLTESYFVMGVAAITVMCLIGIGIQRRLIWSGRKKGHLDEYGQVCNFIISATPMRSMICALMDVGVQPQDLTGLFIQTCNFDNPYVHKFEEKFREYGINCPVEITGYGSEEQAVEIANRIPKTKVFSSTDMLTEHFSIAKTAGKMFIWYEPYHVSDGGPYAPRDGAFLVEVKADKEPDAMRHYQGAKASQMASSDHQGVFTVIGTAVAMPLTSEEHEHVIL